MLIMQIENLKKSYGERQLFRDINFSIHDTDKIGLIGVNGTGKTSLLKALAGVEPADAGNLVIPKGIQVAYLSQNPEFNEDHSVLEAVFAGDSPLLRLIRDYEDCLMKLGQEPENQQRQSQLLSLQAKMDADGAWEAESQIKTVLTQLKIVDFEQPMHQLSGGQRKRVALAQALISDAQLLILDEPTNHMDSSTVEWLEGYLKQRKGALLMVTHDRYFLDRVVNKTIELDQGNIYTYTGNYAFFVEQKALRNELEDAMQRKRQNLYRTELAWIRAGAQARSTKQKARIDRFENLKDKVENTASKENMSISVAHSRLGSKIIELNAISKAFDDITIVKDFTYTMVKDDRIGLVGPSGIGKTTVLKLMLGEMAVDSGSVDTGITVKVGYFSQEAAEMPKDKRAIDWIRDTAEFVTTGDGVKISASQMMERFLFDSNLQYTYIHRLSGGEKRRLYLLQVLMGSPNVLVLDEPTNDLDIDTLKVLEDYLEEFAGAVIVISHDRYFLDRTCERIWHFEGNGDIRVHTGNYSEFLEQLKAAQPKAEPVASKPLSKSTPSESVVSNAPKAKLSFKEIHELKTIDAEVEALEQQLAAVEDQIAACISDFVKLSSLTEEKDLLEMALLEKLERQEYLHQFD